MALELNGQPFGLNEDQLTKYSKRMVFRVGKQYISKNRVPEMRGRIEAAIVGIIPAYTHYTLTESKLRKPLGTLVYYESKTWVEGRKTFDYTPARIETPDTGWFESTNPELNFFLDNHPNNEEVFKDEDHPNREPKAQTYFSTYVRKRAIARSNDLIKLSAELALKLLDSKKTPEKEINALAHVVVRQARDYKIQHRLTGLKDMEPDDIRAEMVRLAQTYPMAIQSITESENTDYTEKLLEFIEYGVLKLQNGVWISQVEGKAKTDIVRVPEGSDANKVIIDFFRNTDAKGAKFKMLRDQLAAAKLKVAPVE